MANQSKLKAWVRYDGTGRVISGGPIFQVNKPKVGNWKQIDANLCCNSGSTTTTTTQGGGSVTPTAFVKGYWLNTNDSCTTTLAGSLVFYSVSTDVQAGITVFSDAELTIPVTQGYVIYSGPMMAETRYLVGAGGVLSVYVCPTVYTVGIDSTPSGACNYNIMQNINTNDNLTLSNSTITITSTGASFSNLLGLPEGSTFYVSFGAIVWQYQISGIGAFSGTRIGNGANC